jgi:hypothetical protein
MLLVPEKEAIGGDYPTGYRGSQREGLGVYESNGRDMATRGVAAGSAMLVHGIEHARARAMT